MSSTHHHHRMRPLSLLLLLLAMLSLESSTTALSSNGVAIPYQTLGPNYTYPHGIQVLNTRYNISAYNGGVLNLSWPVVEVAASFTAIDGYRALDGLEFFLAAYVDIINYRGGINVNGTRHLLSLTYALNDESDAYMTLIYQDLSNTGRFPLMLAPAYQQLQTLAPIIGTLNTTLIAVNNPDPKGFTSVVNDNLFGTLMTADLAYPPAMTMINERAKLYYIDIANGDASDSSNTDSLSPYGITTICIFANNDSLSQTYVGGVRQWIETENQLRRTLSKNPSDWITTLVDSVWFETNVGDYSNYTLALDTCPDNVDVLLAVPTVTSGVDVCMALAESRLRPKAVLGLDYSNVHVGAGTAISSGAEGWLVVNPANLSRATYPGSKFLSGSEALQAYMMYGTAFPGMEIPLTVSVILYEGALDLIASVLSTTQSLTRAGIRQTLLGLQGSLGLLSAINFNTTNGLQMATPNNNINQIINGKSVAIPTSQPSKLLYPYDWPWHRTQEGDDVDKSQTVQAILIAIVITVLGCWVSLIVIEQAIFVRRKGGNFRLWLLITSLSLGGVGVWCGFFTQMSALTLTKPDTGNELPMKFSINIAFLAFLPAIALTYLGLRVYICEIEDQSQATKLSSEAAQVKAQLRLEREEKQKRAALNHREHLSHLLHSLNWRSIVGGLLIVLAVLTCRVTLFYAWLSQATQTTEVWAWCLTVAVKLLIVPIAVHMYFFAIRMRPVAAFLLASAFIFDWQTHINTMHFAYSPTRYTNPSPSNLYTTLVDSVAVQIITGVLAAVICFVFIGLQFSRMKLSRNGLSVLVASLEAIIQQQRKLLRDDSVAMHNMKLYSDCLCKVIETINLVTPFASETAFLMASQCNVASFAAFHGSDSGHRRLSSTNGPRGLGLAGTLVGEPFVSSVSHSPRTSKRSSIKGYDGELKHEMVLPKSGVSLITRNASARVSVNGSQLASAMFSVPNSVTEEGALLPVSGECTPGSTRSTRILAITNNVKDSCIDEPVSARAAESDADSDNTSNTDSITAALTSIERRDSNINASTINVTAEVDSADSGLLFTRASISSTTPLHLAAQRKQSLGGNDKRPSVNPTSHAIKPSSHLKSESASIHPISNLNMFASPASRSSASQQAPLQTSRDTVTSASSASKNKSFKSFEDACIELIEQYNEYKEKNVPVNKRGSRTSRSSISAGDDDDSLYQFTTPLLLSDSGRDESLALPVHAQSPTLSQLLSHPICVELLKHELQAIHSVEMISFWLFANRYHKCQSAKLRRMLAFTIYETFIAEGSAQQININTRQRDAIAAVVISKKSHNEELFTIDLFRDAKLEVCLLMETNLMKTFVHTAKYRLCAFIYHTINVNDVTTHYTADFDRTSQHVKQRRSLIGSSTGGTGLLEASGANDAEIKSMVHSRHNDH